MAFLCTSQQYYIRPCSLQHICWYDCNLPPRLLAMFGLFCPERPFTCVELASQQSLACFFCTTDISHPLACHVWALLSQMPIHSQWMCLTAILYWALWPHLMAVSIISLPHGNDVFCCASQWYQLFLCLTVMINFFSASRQYPFFSSPHGNDQFFLCLTAALPTSLAISNGPILELRCPIGFLASCFDTHSCQSPHVPESLATR